MNKRFEVVEAGHRRFALRAFAVAALVVGVVLGVSQTRGSEHHATVTKHRFVTSLGRAGNGSGEADRLDGANQEIYSNQAYPAPRSPLRRHRRLGQRRSRSRRCTRRRP